MRVAFVVVISLLPALSFNSHVSVLCLVPYLVECGYFKEVNFIFLVVGHTKNAADHLFNCLKELYQKSNIGTMAKLYTILDTSPKVTVYPTTEDDFHHYGDFF